MKKVLAFFMTAVMVCSMGVTTAFGATAKASQDKVAVNGQQIKMQAYNINGYNYFKLRDNESVIDGIMDAFGLTGPNRHIINGHVPVHVTSGENPIKANGKLMVIDGGFSEAYHSETGIAGYTLVYHSRGFQLVQHEPFTSAEHAVLTGSDIKSTTQIIEMSNRRMLVADTDKGEALRQRIDELQKLLYAYRHGYIKERDIKK